MASINETSFMLEVMMNDPALISKEYGVERHRWINNNAVSYIQREAMYAAYYALIRNLIKREPRILTIGGSRSEFPCSDQCIKQIANVVGDNDILNYDGVHLNGVQDNFFDIVTTCHSFEHFKNQEESTKEIIRVLNKGGFLINIIPDRMYHRHDLRVKTLGDQCFREFTATEGYAFFNAFPELEIVQFNTRLNRLDFDIVLRKK